MSQLRIGTFNIQGFITEGEYAWEKRATSNAKIVQEQHIDSLGFQEFHSNNLDIYHKMVPEFSWYYGFDEGNGMLQNPIAWNKNRFSAIKQGSFWLTEDGYAGTGWDATIPRSCSWVLLWEKNNNRTILHANTHLDHLSETARVEGTKIILAMLSEYKKLPVIVTGDFNCSPYKPNGIGKYTAVPYKLFKKEGFKHAWEETHSDWPTTYHGYKGESYTVDEFGTWHIDGILFKNLNCLTAEIIHNSKPPLYPSDHWPVTATFTY